MTRALRAPGPLTARSPWSPEIAGCQSLAEPGVLEHACQRAERLGIGADEVLHTQGTASADELARAAARHLGLAFAPLDGDHAALGMPDLQISEREIISLLRSGLARGADGSLVLAARGTALRDLAGHLQRAPALAVTMRLTTPERLASYVRRRFELPLAEHAAFALRRSWPALSAATLDVSRHVLLGLALMLVALPFAIHLQPSYPMVVVALGLAGLLLGWSGLRLTACTMEHAPDPPPSRNDAELPVYTLLVPLYREARIAPQLVAALGMIDYPKEKLQVLLIVEPDDHETAAALRRHATAPWFEVFVAPPLGPRTKPKALNGALSFARGEIVGVFDAEDVPDPQQLRRACAMFKQRRGERVACVQARLAIDNLADSWITRQFAAEYAAHFDVVLPMLAALRLPMPLGGTSNHFRRDVLESIGGWDPYNVTEDADLGVRLARAGWHTAVIDSTTDEEAPHTARSWVVQRTRWYKGWLQTVLVHGRHPLHLYRDLGLYNTAALNFMLGGSLAAALMHPFFLMTLVIGWCMGHHASGVLASVLLEGIGVAVLAVGYSTTLLCTAMGMRRRRISGLWRVLPLVPAYWLMLSLAAWRALFQLLFDPQRWEKTEHGLARTSRGRRRPGRPASPTNSAADRRPRRSPAA